VSSARKSEGRVKVGWPAHRRRSGLDGLPSVKVVISGPLERDPQERIRTHSLRKKVPRWPFPIGAGSAFLAQHRYHDMSSVLKPSSRIK
jgi:hypothetical protein